MKIEPNFESQSCSTKASETRRQTKLNDKTKRALVEGENKNEGILRSDRRYRSFEIGKRKDSGMVNIACVLIANLHSSGSAPRNEG